MKFPGVASPDWRGGGGGRKEYEKRKKKKARGKHKDSGVWVIFFNVFQKEQEEEEMEI